MARGQKIINDLSKETNEIDVSTHLDGEDTMNDESNEIMKVDDVSQIDFIDKLDQGEIIYDTYTE